jgi:DNA-binding transcriptional LysR family regulator
LVQALEEGHVDLAIGYFPDLKKGDFFQQRLFTHHFVCLLPHFPSIPSLIARSDLVATVPHAVGLAYGNQAHGLKVSEPLIVGPLRAPPRRPARRQVRRRSAARD